MSWSTHPNSTTTSTTNLIPPSSSTPIVIPPSAYITAYESQLIYDGPALSRRGSSVDRLGLVRWAGTVENDQVVEDDFVLGIRGGEAVDRSREMKEDEVSGSHGREVDEVSGSHGREVDQVSGGRRREEDEKDEDIWLDRYDILHLLTSLPMANPNPSSITNTNPSSTTNTNAIAVATNAIAGPSTRSSSPSPSSSSSGWTDLPSDQEEMFYASDEDERERLRGQRRREWVDKLREERVRDREREERDKGREEVQAAAAKDLEEPSPDILTLMHHTATSLLASPNPRILELRIMTHHASDPRFNFLRGRHPLAWARIKAQVKVEKAKKEDPERIKREQGKVAGLVGGYESDSEDEDEDEGEPKDSPPPLPDDSQDPDPEELDGKDPVVRKDGKESVSRIDSHGSVISLHGDGSVIQVDGKGSVIQVHGKGPVIRVDGHGSVDDIMSTPPMTADQEASEEKKRIRRLKAEEWKRKRAQVAEER